LLIAFRTEGSRGRTAPPRDRGRTKASLTANDYRVAPYASPPPEETPARTEA